MDDLEKEREEYYQAQEKKHSEELAIALMVGLGGLILVVVYESFKWLFK